MALLRAAPVVALVAAVTTTSAGTAAATVIGPDVSSYNHSGGSSLNWSTVRRVGGERFVFIKATEGGGYRNPSFTSDFAAAHRHSLIRGAYHFAHPGGGSNSQIAHNATAEAVQFGHAIGTLSGPGNLPPVLDLEDAGTLNPTQLSLWTHTWLNRMMKLTGRVPIIYTGVSFWQQNMGNSAGFASYPLWLASYGVSRPAMVGGWRRYTFWQYTETGRLAGAGSNTDLSIFNGSSAQLEAMTMPEAAKAEAAKKAAAIGARATAARASAAAAAAVVATAVLTTKYTSRGDVRQPKDASRSALPSSRSKLPTWLGAFGAGASGRAISGL